MADWHPSLNEIKMILPISGRIIDRNFFFYIEVFPHTKATRHIADDIRIKMADWQPS